MHDSQRGGHAAPYWEKKQKLTDKNQFKNQPIFIFFLKKNDLGHTEKVKN